jgi:protein ImuA
MIPRRDPNVLAALKTRLRGLETAGGGAGAVPFGLAAIDRWLPGGGLPRVGVHELIAARGSGAGFAAALAGRCLKHPGQDHAGAVLWVARHAELYGPGLAPFGLPPERLIVVAAARETDVLWVLEEALRTRGLAVVIGELSALDLTAARRLQLAAEAGGGTGLVLRPAERADGIAAACSRWRVAAVPAAPPSTDRKTAGAPWTRWRLALERCRGVTGAPAPWMVEWCDATGDFALAAAPGDRPAQPARAATGSDPRRFRAA